MKIKTALKAAAVAASLVFATASHAAIDFPAKDTGQVFEFGAGGAMLHPNDGTQPVETYDLSGSTLAAAILAFCVQPTVEQVGGAVYTQHAAVASLSSISLFADNGLDHRATRIQALFEQNYDHLASSADRLGFALALWDLVGDDGSLSSGAQHFTSDAFALSLDSGDQIDLVAVETMLNNTIGASLSGTYQYTLFTGRTANSAVDNSQALLSVSAVPEADTWAMMAVGLGLIGFMGRRRSSQSEKFAA
ncbi:PEP-CTERM sorting domain-containing protein [Duganella radicis]|nr:PEP-CTERM sorting domain-containing protein [Duganella radicis]